MTELEDLKKQRATLQKERSSLQRERKVRSDVRDFSREKKVLRRDIKELKQPRRTAVKKGFVSGAKATGRGIIKGLDRATDTGKSVRKRRQVVASRRKRKRRSATSGRLIRSRGKLFFGIPVKP